MAEPPKDESEVSSAFLFSGKERIKEAGFGESCLWNPVSFRPCCVFLFFVKGP